MNIGPLHVPSVTFMPADLAGQNALRHRTFSKILGDGDWPYIKEIILSWKCFSARLV